MAKKNDIKITNRFFIRSIEPKLMNEKYIKGFYSNISIPTKKILLSGNVTKLDHDVGSNGDSEIYSFIDRMGERRIVVTLNQHNYNIQKNEENKKYPCNWCRRSWPDNMSIGIPISVYTESKDKYVFVVSDFFCSFECAYAYLIQFTTSNKLSLNPIYVSSEQLLKMYHRILYPHKIFPHPRPDWRLYRENGGPLSKEEYFSSDSVYQEIPGVYIQHSKHYFIKNNL